MEAWRRRGEHKSWRAVQTKRFAERDGRSGEGRLGEGMKRCMRPN